MNKPIIEDSFKSLRKAIFRLREVLELPNVDTLLYLQDSAIQRFEFTIELYWKVLKKILLVEKIESISPRDVMEKAYQTRLIDDEKVWLKMLDDRNRTSHMYSEEEAADIFERTKEYLIIFEKTYAKLKEKYPDIIK